ncbi:MAG TPA: glycine betaine ABC transporter substrate-binding protein [Bacillota bacterium]
MRTHRRWKALVAAFLAVLLAGTACGGAGQPAETQEPINNDQTSNDGTGDGSADKPTIVLGDAQWQTLWILNAIAKFIIEEGYGYPVRIETVSTPIMQQGLTEGDIHVGMEIWWVNYLDWWNQSLESGDVIDLGTVFERSTQGFYVPRYVIEGDPERGIEPTAPDLRSVAQLPDYKDLFADPNEPGKGLLISCITGWECSEVNRIKLHAYGLDDDYNLLEPGTAPALDAAIVGAYEDGEPFVTYYWEPTWLMGALDMVQLEEPPYTEECGAVIQEALEGRVAYDQVGEAAACGYQSYDVRIGAWSGLADLAPDVVEFLRAMEVGTDPVNELSAYMTQNEVEADATAIHFFENYQERWRSWLPDDVEQRVEDALIAAGAQL